MNLVPIITLFIFPGILWALIDTKFSYERTVSIGYFTMYAVIFGVVNYFVLFTLIEGFPNSDINRILDFDILKLEIDGNSLTIREFRTVVGWSLLLPIALSFFWIRIKNSKILNKLYVERNLGLNARVDIWTRTHLEEGPEFNFVRIMDFENKIICEGYVQKYSDSEEPRELLLSQVLVTDLVAKYEYELPYLYISPLPEKIWMEFPSKDIETERTDAKQER